MKDPKALTVWELPKPEPKTPEEHQIEFKEPEEYFIAVRTHQGLLDKDCVEIFNSKTYEQALETDRRINPDTLAKLLVKLGKRYNEAMIAVETGGHGVTILGLLHSLGYTNIYYESVRDLTNPLRRSARMGWEMTKQKKTKAIDDLAQYIRDKKIIINSKPLIKELQAYVVDDKGDTRPQQVGNYDNRIIATAICLQVIIERRKWNYIKPKKDPEPFNRDKWIQERCMKQTKKKVSDQHRLRYMDPWATYDLDW